MNEDCQPSGCPCLGHKVAGVYHLVPCCDEPHIKEDPEKCVHGNALLICGCGRKNW